jgi:glycerophosphoryl diester phosphodiesterase
VLIVAHRGFSAKHPENGVGAFEAAIAAGADYIETDVRLTRDGIAVCWHDPDLTRLAGRSEAIADLAHAEVDAVLAATGRTLLTLDAVLALARGRARVMLDVKVKSAAMIDAIASAMRAQRMLADAMFGMRDPAQHPSLRRAAPKLALLAMPPDPDALPDFLLPGVSAVRLWEHEVTAARIARIHGAQRDVWVTAGLKPEGEAPGAITDRRLMRLQALMVNGVLVNDPQRAAAVLRARPAACNERRAP